MISGLLRHLLESTAFALVIALLVFWWKDTRAAVRYRLWLLATLKFAVPTQLLFALGRWTHRTWIPERWLPIRLWPLLDANPLLPSSSWGTPVPDQAWRMVLVFLWIVGTLLCFGAWLVRLRRARQTTNAPEFVIPIVWQLQRQMNLRRSVQIRSVMPEGDLALTGIWSPVLLLPQGLCESLTRNELEAVLRHELMHARRWDNLAAVLVHSVVCCFWFHPALWWIERRLSEERELACDEAVIDYGSSAREYVTGILKVCRFHFADLQPGTCGMAGLGLEKRKEWIMSYKSGHPASFGSKIAVTLLSAAMTFMPMIIGFWQTSALYGYAGREGDQLEPPLHKAVSCIADSKSYPEGTTIEREGVQQLCVESFGKPMWVRTTAEMRERSRAVIVLPKPPAILCEPQASTSAKFCACQNGSYSPGAIVSSARGRLTCAAGSSRPSTRQELGLK